jgi:ATP-dependent exoDNAse (exonuclease V) alpha subunit
VVRYTKGSQTHNLDAGEYVRVHRVNARENLLTVTRANGERVTYDPRRLQGVTLYRETDRAFAEGDRVQFTAPFRERHVANRELGTVERIDASGHVQLRLDTGRAVTFKVERHPHLDYGYAVTSHSSQGQTADRVLVHVDTERAGETLVNRRLAYVALSRGRSDMRLYTNDKSHLAETLGRHVSHRSAIEPSLAAQSSAPQIDQSVAPGRAAQQTLTR